MSDPRPGGRRSQAGGGGFAQSMAFSAARGGGLIALAIVIGLVLLQVIDTSGGGATNGGVTVTTDPADAPDPEPSEPTEPGDDPEPLPETRPPEEVRVMVLNGADPEEPLAGALTEELRIGGYQTVAPDNTDPRSGTIVLCKEEFAAEAPPLAEFVGDLAVVEPFPETPPSNAENVGAYDCLVVIGS